MVGAVIDRKRHWDDVYARQSDTAVSWFQPRPEVSLALIRATGSYKADPIIDVGGGASHLVDTLLGEGFGDVTVLDIASGALQSSRHRLGKEAARVHWITADVTAWRPERRYRLWHDRAVFHFLVEAEDRAAYRAALTSALLPGGHAVIASFAPDGPERCSGLPVQRYSPDSLATELGADFRLIYRRSEDHTTPIGRLQRFQYSVFEYKPG